MTILLLVNEMLQPDNENELNIKHALNMPFKNIS